MYYSIRTMTSLWKRKNAAVNVFGNAVRLATKHTILVIDGKAVVICRTYECAKTSNGNKVEVNIFSNQISCPNIGNCSKNRVQYKDCCPHCDDGTSSDSTNKRNLLRIDENHDTLIPRDTYINHPCRRECVKNNTKTCTYKFVVSDLMHHNRITTTHRPKFISQ